MDILKKYKTIVKEAPFIFHYGFVLHRIEVSIIM